MGKKIQNERLYSDQVQRIIGHASSGIYATIINSIILGGMVAGTVGVFASIKSAFFCFSIPALLPILINLFQMNSPIHYAMGAMLFVFWLIMLITTMRLDRELVEALGLKYENLDLISDLEREIKDRKAAEERLLTKNQEIETIIHERTADLINVNNKLIAEIKERFSVCFSL